MILRHCKKCGKTRKCRSENHGRFFPRVELYCRECDYYIGEYLL